MVQWVSSLKDIYKINKVFQGLLHCSRPYSNITLKLANLGYLTRDNLGLEGFHCTGHSRKPCSFLFTTGTCRSYRSPLEKLGINQMCGKNKYATTNGPSRPLKFDT